MKKILLTCLMLVFVLYAWAQDRIVSGTVSDGETGEVLPGVTVLLKGTTNGATTDVDGNYKINVPVEGGSLIFTFIGMERVEEVIGTRSVIDVQMVSDIQQLTEVVVTANSIEREKKALGYSISEVESEDLLKARETNIVNSLQGRVAGVNVTNSGGSIGGSSRVLIRGAAALSSDIQPLFVVDGVPIFNSNIRSVPGDGGDAAYANDYDYGNGAQDINPDDVASMTVLKGATAAALYGQRARNGAIIITTKKGKNTKGKTQISVNSNLRLDNVFRTPDIQTKYAPGTNGDIRQNTLSGWGGEITGQTNLNGAGQWLGAEGPNAGKPLQAYSDNFDNFFETGKTLTNSIAFGSGNEKMNYRLGYTNVLQTGIVPNTELATNTISLNAGAKLENNISTSVGIQYVNTDNDGRPTVGFNNSIGSLVYNFPNTYDITQLRDYKDEFGVQRPLTEGSDNPYWLLNENVFELDRDRLIGNVTIQYDPFSFLNITGRLGSDISSEKRFSPTAKGGVTASEGSFFYDDINQSQLNADLISTLSYSFSEDFGTKLILGGNVNQRVTSQFTNRSNTLTAAGLYRPANAEQNITTIDELKQRIVGAYFDLGFDYGGYAFLNVTGRNDWSSTLPKENNSFFYPSVSGSFVFTEAFDIPSNIISFGKIRGSWAQVGSDADPYSLDFQYFPKESVFFVLSGGTGLAFPFGGQLGFEQTGTIPNQQLRPEIQTSYEVGTEIQFFNNRFGVDFNYFNTVTSDQILSLPISPTTGFFGRFINVGETKNTGLELLVTASPISTKNFSWDISANLTKIEQSVVSLADGVEELNLSGGINGLSVKAVPGEPFGLYGTDFLRDSVSGKLIVDESGFRIQEQDVRLGDIYPDFTAGFSNTFTYKGLSLFVLLDYSQGGVLYSNTVADLRGLGWAEETATNRDQLIIEDALTEAEDGSLVPNETAVSPQAWWVNNTNTEAFSTFNNTFLKLREARIAYRLPKKWLDRTPFGSVNLALSGRNLLLLYSPIPHIDPEQNIFGAGDNASGIEAGGLPATRSYGFNISFTL